TKYVFESDTLIGEGGTAIVYKVRDTQLNVSRALKVLLVDLSADQNAKQRWQREQEFLLFLEEVDAPCVPTIYEVGVVDGLPVIVMQFLNGKMLESILQEWEAEPVPKSANDVRNHLQRILGIVYQLAGSLAHIERHVAGT